MKKITLPIRHKSFLTTLLLVMMIVLSVAGCTAAPAKAASETTAKTTAAETSASETSAAETLSTQAETTVSQEKSFTLEELASFAGQDGAAAYVAVDGIVYDVTNVRKWRNGVHEMGIKAGADLTELMSQSPHGVKVLGDAVKVGILAK